MSTTILLTIAFFLAVILLLVSLLLFAKSRLSPSGTLKLVINGERTLEVEGGSTLLTTLGNAGVFLPSACGGGGTCVQCRCQVPSGGGTILPTEEPHFSRKEIADHWRLGCQVKVKEDMEIQVPEEVFGIKKWECEVVSNYNVASFIKEFVQLAGQGPERTDDVGAVHEAEQRIRAVPGIDGIQGALRTPEAGSLIHGFEQLLENGVIHAVLAQVFDAVGRALGLALVELESRRRRTRGSAFLPTSAQEQGNGHKRDRQHKAGGIPKGVAETHHPPKSSKATFSGGTPQSSHILRTAWFMSGGPQK